MPCKEDVLPFTYILWGRKALSRCHEGPRALNLTVPFGFTQEKNVGMVQHACIHHETPMGS